jgi:hypothetical protein
MTRWWAVGLHRREHGAGERVGGEHDDGADWGECGPDFGGQRRRRQRGGVLRWHGLRRDEQHHSERRTDNAEAFFDGTGYAGTNNVIPTVTTATNVTTVNGLAAGVITAAAIATNAIDADALAADAVTEIQSGLATAAALTTIDDFLDTEIAAILADTNELQTDWVNGGRLDLLIDAIKAKTDNLPSDPADDSDIDTQLAAIAAYLDTEVAAILAAVDTEVAAIKTKTDYLPSATAGAAGGVFIAGSNAATTVAITGNITGNLSGSVGSVTGNVGGNVAAAWAVGDGQRGRECDGQRGQPGGAGQDGCERGGG